MKSLLIIIALSGVILISGIKATADPNYRILTDTMQYNTKAGVNWITISTIEYRIENTCNDTLWLWLDRNEWHETDTVRIIRDYFRRPNRLSEWSLLSLVWHSASPTYGSLYRSFAKRIAPAQSFTIYKPIITYDYLPSIIDTTTISEIFCIPEKRIFALDPKIKFIKDYDVNLFYQKDVIVLPFEDHSVAAENDTINT